jgi:hypothetical protein
VGDAWSARTVFTVEAVDDKEMTFARANIRDLPDG